MAVLTQTDALVDGASSAWTAAYAVTLGMRHAVITRWARTAI